MMNDDLERSDGDGQQHEEFEDEERMLSVGRVPFDIEKDDSNLGGFGSVKNPISVPALLKTILFILVWYAFSTCLTMWVLKVSIFLFFYFLFLEICLNKYFFPPLSQPNKLKIKLKIFIIHRYFIYQLLHFTSLKKLLNLCEMENMKIFPIFIDSDITRHY